MDKLEAVRKVVDTVLMEQTNTDLRRSGFVHLYGVANFCSLLAKKRGVDVELSTITGMLHDIATYKTGNSFRHAEFGAVEAEHILRGLELFRDEEIEQICKAIVNHSSKQKVDEPLDELLKDADVLHHYFYNTNFPLQKNEMERLRALSNENGFTVEDIKEA